MDAESLKADGWQLMGSGRGFTAACGPYWVRGEGATREVGFIAESRHSNQNPETVHGGALMSFADIALGWSATDALGHKRCVTAELKLHFVSSGKVGEFISCRAEVVRAASSLVFMRGLVKAGERTVAAADGIWKVLERKS
jgi:acyl-coenzyme A thioesterase PaaI-like protein